MGNFKDQELYTAFLDLGKFILDTLDKKTDNNVKELFELDESGISKILKKHLKEILESNQYKNFEKLLLDNNNYEKNFKTAVGTSDTLHNIKIDFLVENIFFHYIRENSIVWNQNLIDQYYDNIEKFLIDDQFIVTVTTPVFGLKVTSNNFQIEDDISINRIQKPRKFKISSSIHSLRYAVAYYDLIIKFSTKKIYKEISDEEKRNSIVHRSKTMIQNLMMVLRLCHGGRIGFLDSEFSLSIPVGIIGWLNPRCDLPKDWNSWIEPTYIFTENDIEEIKKLRIEINKLFDKEKTKFLFVSIDRFMTSYEQDNVEDRILDLIISLESLLLQEMDELRYRLSIRTAKFLGKTAEERNRIYKTILAAYKIRSETAHGASLQRVTVGTEELTLETLADLVEEYVRTAIKQMIKLLNQDESFNSIKSRLDDSLFLEVS